MSLEEQRFAFETTPYRPEGTELILLRDATDRWVIQSPDVTLGSTAFEAVYRLSEGRFVRAYGAGFRRVDALKPWETPAPIEIGFYSGWRLIQFFRDNKIPLPADLAKLVDEAETASNRVRPLEELLQIDFPIARAGSATHQVDWRWLTGHLQELLVDVINELRTGTNKCYSSDSIYWLCRFLSQRYDVDVAHWWGAKGTIPPATVDIFELPWPKEFAEAVSALRAFRERAWKLLRICDKQYRIPGAPAGYPSDAERGFVWKLLVEMLPELESLVSDFLKGIPDESGNTAAPDPPAAETVDLAVKIPIFVSEQSTWAVIYKEQRAAFPDQLGIRYLAELVSKPDRLIPAATLAGLKNPRQAPPTMSPQPVIDPTTQRNCHEYLQQLNAEIGDAEETGNTVKATTLKQEQLRVSGEILRQTDDKGNSRMMSNDSEKHRTPIGAAIDRALIAIGKKLPALRVHFERTIKRGNFFPISPVKTQLPIRQRDAELSRPARHMSRRMSRDCWWRNRHGIPPS